MLVVGIVGIIAGLATPSLIGYYRSASVGATMRALYSGFIEAQGLAKSKGVSYQLFVDRTNQKWQILADNNGDGTYEALIRTQTLSTTAIGFGPTSGYGESFPVPYNTIANSGWCSFCGVGTSGTVNFMEDGTVQNGTSGSVLIFDAEGKTQRIDALVFIGATGDVRIFRK